MSYMNKSAFGQPRKIASHFKPINTAQNYQRPSKLTKIEKSGKSTIKSEIPNSSLIFDGNRSKCNKIFWLLFVIATGTICIYQIGDRIDYYFSEPIRTEMEATRMTYIKFPSVTVCPGFSQYPLMLTKEMEYMSQNIPKHKNKKCEILLQDILEYSQYNITKLWKLSSIADNTVVGFFLHNINAIQPKIIKNVLDTVYGRCHTYNLPDPINFYEFTAIFSVVIYWKDLCPNKNLATLHSEEDYPMFYFHLLKDAAGLHDVIYYPMKLSVYNRISLRRRRCNDKDSVASCRYKCYEDEIAKNIKCRTPNFNLPNIPYCHNNATLYGTYDVINKMDKTFNVHYNCPHCLIKCEENIYEAARTETTMERLKGSSFSYYFENNIVYVITENKAYSFISLLCDIGGNLGLYLGLCLINIAQMFENFILRVVKTTPVVK